MHYHTIPDNVTKRDGEEEKVLLAGRYRVVRQLGHGNMGFVWLVEDTQLDNKLFAIKMLPSILVNNKRAYRQLKDEALVAMKLTHPNIVTLRAFEENNGNPFLVMDYVDGQTLDDYLAEHGGGNLTQSRGEAESQRGLGNGCGCGISEDEVIRILKPIAAALDYAHGEGVVHRDVKPANVMIRKDGHPFILDFGIAREIQETMFRVNGKLSSGTLLYMSPEQLNGDAPKKEQDIYSFAVMAYECIKGEPPFVRGAIEDQIKNKEPEPLQGDARFCETIMSGLAKNPEDRPATCAEVLGGNDLAPGHREAEAQSGRADVPPPPQSASVPYSQADCVRLKADARVVQRHIARFSDNPDCRRELREIEDDFLRADTIFAERQWALAAACYARIVERGKALEDAVDGRAEEEKKARHEAVERKHGEADENVRRESEGEDPRMGPPSGTERTITLPRGVEMRFRWCRPGTFTMGSPAAESGRFDDETQHSVTLTRGFWMGETPVTQRQWECVMGCNPSSFKGEDRPVENVSWDECRKFMEKMNEALNCGARLPTEAEWEYACRAGAVGPYGGTGKLDEMGWYEGNQTYHLGRTLFGLVETQLPDGTHAVGGKGANAWGLHDMHGNVWEWCGDWYGGYASMPTNDPQGPSSGSSRVLRGGSWCIGARGCRSAYRDRREPGCRIGSLGFRVVLAPGEWK